MRNDGFEWYILKLKEECLFKFINGDIEQFNFDLNCDIKKLNKQGC